MISDEDRIEAARFLRSCNCDSESYAKCYEISEALFGKKYAICDFNVPCGKIADLIDRGECENVYDENEMGACDNGFECSVCGCRVEDEEHYHVSGEWNFCPKCGRKVVEGGH